MTQEHLIKIVQANSPFSEFEAREAKMAADPVREKALSDYRKKLMEHKEVVNLVVYDFLVEF